jgi:hypothetical protein
VRTGPEAETGTLAFVSFPLPFTTFAGGGIYRWGLSLRRRALSPLACFPSERGKFDRESVVLEYGYFAATLPAGSPADENLAEVADRSPTQSARSTDPFL